MAVLMYSSTVIFALLWYVCACVCLYRKGWPSETTHPRIPFEYVEPAVQILSLANGGRVRVCVLRVRAPDAQVVRLALGMGEEWRSHISVAVEVLSSQPEAKL